MDFQCQGDCDAEEPPQASSGARTLGFLVSQVHGCLPSSFGLPPSWSSQRSSGGPSSVFVASEHGYAEVCLQFPSFRGLPIRWKEN